MVFEWYLSLPIVYLASVACAELYSFICMDRFYSNLICWHFFLAISRVHYLFSITQTVRVAAIRNNTKLHCYQIFFTNPNKTYRLLSLQKCRFSSCQVKNIYKKLSMKMLLKKPNSSRGSVSKIANTKIYIKN